MKEIVYILSMSHSGSTLNDLLIGSHSKIQSCGEVRQLKKYIKSELRPNQSDRCSCGAKPLISCKFWSKVLSNIKRKGQFSYLISSSKDKNNEIKSNEILFDEIFNVSKKNIILDSSKSLKKLNILLLSKYKIHTIYLIRDPLGQINSILRKRKYTIKNFMHALISYIMTNIKFLLFLKKNKVNFFFINYNVFANNPYQIIENYHTNNLKLIGEKINWKNTVIHNINGNRMRFNRNVSIKLDNKWVNELPFIYKITILIFAYPIYLLIIIISK